MYVGGEVEMGRRLIGREPKVRRETSASEGGQGLGSWIKRHWLLSAAIGALVTSSVGFVVNRYVPGIIDKLSGKDPLRFTIREDPDAYTEGHSFVIRGGPPADVLPPAVSCQQVRSWAMGHGAIDGGRTHLKVSIEGLNDTPVLIESMHARVERRTEPISETVVSCLTEGEIGIIGIGFNLDEQPSPARSLSGEHGELGEPYFQSSNISVAKGEVLAMAVTAFTEGCFCQWRMEVNAVVEGERETFILDDGGRPFQTTAVVTLPPHKLAWYGGEWASCEGAVVCFPGSEPAPITGEYLSTLQEQGTIPVLP
jgi:hypothetical protein